MKHKICIRCKVALRKVELKDVYQCPVCFTVIELKDEDE